MLKETKVIKIVLVIIVLLACLSFLTKSTDSGFDRKWLLNHWRDILYRTYLVGGPDNSIKDKENNFYGHIMSITQEQTSKDYIAEMNELNMRKVNMDDPRLINLIKNYWIENPSREPYNLKDPHVMDPSIGQAAVVDNKLEFQIMMMKTYTPIKGNKFFHKQEDSDKFVYSAIISMKEGGFYVECGGLDGETRSNTLLFERFRKWNGIVIEADQLNYASLKKKHRKAFTINACLSVYPYPVKMHFKPQFNIGKLVQEDNAKGKIIEVQCFPLYSILLALNVTHIDFFSLDVEGAELSVLKTIPFERVDIEMMTVEFKHVSDGELTLKRFVEQKGYSSELRVSHYFDLANDIIFRKKRH